MAVCKFCGAELPRCAGYKGEKYGSYKFCDKECYDNFLLKREREVLSQPLRKLKDYLNDLYGGEINWVWMQKQIKNMMNEYDMNYQDIRLTVKYAVDYEDYVVDPSYGLGQFVKFIEPAKRFAEKIERAKEYAKTMPEQEYIYVTPHKQGRRKVKEEDWID